MTNKTVLLFRLLLCKWLRIGHDYSLAPEYRTGELLINLGMQKMIWTVCRRCEREICVI